MFGPQGFFPNRALSPKRRVLTFYWPCGIGPPEAFWQGKEISLCTTCSGDTRILTLFPGPISGMHAPLNHCNGDNDCNRSSRSVEQYVPREQCIGICAGCCCCRPAKSKRVIFDHGKNDSLSVNERSIIHSHEVYSSGWRYCRMPPKVRAKNKALLKKYVKMIV